jgi:uncharacterized membrane protein YphA (DoxX/SURF4 family)
MLTRRVLSNMGQYAYGVAAIALGVVGLVWGDFATNWQRVQANVPHREALAYLTAGCELFSGLAILWRRTARIGAVALTLIYSVFALLWAVQIFASPRVYDVWGNFFEELSLVIGGAVAVTVLAPPGSPGTSKSAPISRLFGICAISFGLDHFFYLRGAASFVPKWIPPGQMFWAVATAVFFLLAAIALLSGILAGLASRLLTAMIVGFEVLVWAPRLFTFSHDHFSWAGNGICLAIAGAAWVVSDSISASQPAYASAPAPTLIRS